MPCACMLFLHQRAGPTQPFIHRLVLVLGFGRYAWPSINYKRVFRTNKNKTLRLCLEMRTEGFDFPPHTNFRSVPWSTEAPQPTVACAWTGRSRGPGAPPVADFSPPPPCGVVREGGAAGAAARAGACAAAGRRREGAPPHPTGTFAGAPRPGRRTRSAPRSRSRRPPTRHASPPRRRRRTARVWQCVSRASAHGRGWASY